MRSIAICNQSKLITPQALAAAVKSLQVQLDRDFTPWWKIECKLSVTTNPNPQGETIFLVDNTIIPGVLAFHSYNSSDTPYGIVQVELDAQYGEDWRVSLGHEILEQLVDAWCDLGCLVPWRGIPSVFLSRECADPVESQTYLINGIPCTNFVTSYWFQSQVQNARFDFMGTLDAPLKLSPGGYAQWTADGGQTWHDTFAERVPDHKKAARRHGRITRRMRRAMVPVYS